MLSLARSVIPEELCHPSHRSDQSGDALQRQKLRQARNYSRRSRASGCRGKTSTRPAKLTT